MIAVAAPPRVRTVLATVDGPGTVLHAGAHAVYVRVHDRCVGVVGSAAVQVPCALRLASPDLGRLAGATSCHVADGVLHLDGTPLPIGRLVDVSVPVLAALPASARTWSVSVGDAVLAELPRRALDLLEGGDPACVAELIGRGSGLTPVGDDVLCGWLATRAALGEPPTRLAAAIRRALPRTSALSAALLDCALHGETIPEFRDLLLGEDATALCRVGHTSGAGLLLGASLAARHRDHNERSLCA